MARRKKSQQQVQEPQPIQKQNLNIGYAGTVKLTLKAGRTAISTKVYHNKGGFELFKFLCLCLAGRYSAANESRPTLVGLYYNKASKPSESSLDANIEPSSLLVSMNTTAKLVADQANNSCTVIFHFLFPKIYITGDQFNQIILFGANVKDTTETNKYSAVFNLATNDVWATVDTTEWADNFNLVVEWEMTLSNVTTIQEINLNSLVPNSSTAENNG